MEIHEKIIIIFNTEKEDSEAMARIVCKYIKGKKVSAKVINSEDLRDDIQTDSCILVITLGGDGTVLSCARIFAKRNIPIMAVNFGDIGFITEIEKSEWKEVIDDFLQGTFDIKTHLMLNVNVWRSGKKVYEKTGLNDGVITACDIAKIIRLNVSVDNAELGEYRADGIIVATPTGSTAYSAAAGGPLLYPDMDALLLTPICPYSLSSRAIIFPGDKVITVKVIKDQRADTMLTLDGQEVFKLEKEDIIEFDKAHYRALILKSGQNHFFNKVKTKLNWSGGPNNG